MRVLVILVGIMVGSIFANTLYRQPDGTYGPERSFPDDKMIEEIQERLSEYDVVVMSEVTQFLHLLPRRPWPEPLKVILLQIINDYLIDEKYLEWEQEYGHLDDEGAITSNVSDMASWQDDIRFIPYLAQFMGSGNQARDSLIRLGEPAFEVLFKALTRDGWGSQGEALFAFETWLDDNVTFLKSGEKHEQLKKELLRIAQPQDYVNQAMAVRLLRHFNDRNAIRLLQYLSSDEKPVMIHAPFPDRVRKEAFESLDYLQVKESIQLAPDSQGNIPESLWLDSLLGKWDLEIEGILPSTHMVCWQDTCYIIAYVGTFEDQRCSALFTLDADYRAASIYPIGPGCNENRKGHTKAELESIPIADLLPRFKDKSVIELFKVLGMPNLSVGSHRRGFITYNLEKEPVERDPNIVSRLHTIECGFTVTTYNEIVKEFSAPRGNSECVLWYYPPLF